MLAARSPHAYVSLPVAIPMSIMDAGGTDPVSVALCHRPGRRYSYTPFAAFVSALTLSLEINFESPALFYAPSLNRQPAEMESVGWFAGTPILPVRSDKPIMSAVAAERILDRGPRPSEVRRRRPRPMRDGPLLTTIVHRRLSDALGGRLPFMDCLPDSLPYIVLGYADRVRERTGVEAGDVTVTESAHGDRRLSAAACSARLYLRSPDRAKKGRVVGRGGL